MTEPHARFAEWDGAYVLGALSTADRRAYEAHLGGCAACARAVAELAALPALLGTVDPRTAVALIEDPTATAPRAGAAVGADRAGMSGPAAPAGPAGPAGPAEQCGPAGPAVRSAERDRRQGRGGGHRRRWVAIAAAAVIAAVAAATVVFTVQPWERPAPEPPAVALSAVSGAPLTAEVRLTPKAWGTSIAMTCRYPAGPGGRSYVYAMDVTDADGHRSQVSTWRSGPGDTSRLSGATALRPEQIRRVSVRNVDTGTEVLAATLPR